MKITKRTFIRLISYVSATVVAMFGFMIVNHKNTEHHNMQMGHIYSMHLDELDGSLYNISVALQKSLYATTATQLSELAVELCTETTVAKNSLSQLPYSGEELEKVNKFLAQTGDYTLYLSKKVINGGDLEEDERENLHALSKTAQTISGTISQVRLEYDREGVWDKELASGINSAVEESFGSNLTELEELLTDYPTLQYDGPFSDHMLDGEMKMLKDAETVSGEEALIRGGEILGIDVSSFKAEADTKGNVPCYNFTDGKLTFSVTKQGGFVIYMRKHREIKEHTITYDEAVQKAEEYLKNVKNTNFVKTYYFADEGICTVNFAHKEGATVCYTDLIKVGVALDTGEIVLVEAGGYIANHTKRTITTPKYSIDEARQKLSPALKINSAKRCIIPTSGNMEKHCYEFDCIGVDNEEILVYVNVENLEEERILLVVKTDGGTLTK